MSKFLTKIKIIFITIILALLNIEYIYIFYLEYNNTTSFNIRKYYLNNPNVTNILITNGNMLNNSDKIPVITYHMIISDYEKNLKKNVKDTLSVSKSTFSKQMKWLYERGYKTLNCQELYLWHQKKIELPKKSLLITFDGASIGQAKYAIPVLKKYNMKGVTFVLGKHAYRNKKGKINYNTMNKLKQLYPNFDFQSHTYDLHIKINKNDYKLAIKDAAIQKKYFNFTFLAYPYGIYTSGMIKAYKKSGIKMAFTYGINDYATRNQDIYKIRRIKVNGRESFSDFTKWFKD